MTTQRPGKGAVRSNSEYIYLLPSDEEEGKRLLAQHRLYTRLLSDRLIFPPLTITAKDELLDIGTGIGAWMCDVRAHLPETVQLYGVDIQSRLFPSLSGNVHFSICSGTDLPSDWTSKFALVHQRAMILAYRRDQWQRSIAEIYRVLAPGGYVQLIEVGPEWVSGVKTAKHILFLDEFLGKKNMLLRCSIYLADMLKATGFVDVTTEGVAMQMGKWAADDGIEGRDLMISGFRGMRKFIMEEGGFGRFASAAEFDKAIDEVAEEWDNTEGSHVALRVCYGRKPL